MRTHTHTRAVVEVEAAAIGTTADVAAQLPPWATPGFVSVAFSHAMSAAEAQAVAAAVAEVAEQGWKLLPQYAYDVATGACSHVARYSFDNSYPMHDLL